MFLAILAGFASGVVLTTAMCVIAYGIYEIVQMVAETTK